jgi:hypothetical protein
MFLVFMVLLFSSGHTVYQQTVTLAPTLVSGAPESANFTEPFVVDKRGNLQIKTTAPVDNAWLYLDGALINEDTGELDEFDLEMSYYHGYDDGSWSEGSWSAATNVPSVAPGKYVLRLAPQWEAGHTPPPSYTVAVRSRVPHFSHLFWGMVLLFLWPLIASWREFRFSAARWADSDHPYSSQE